MALQHLLEVAKEATGVVVSERPGSNKFVPEGCDYGACLSLMYSEGAMQLGLFGSAVACKGFVRELFGFDDDVALGDSEIVDGLGEIINIVAGRIKQTVLDQGIEELVLGLPSFYYGGDCQKCVTRSIPLSSAQMATSDGLPVQFLWSDRSCCAVLREARSILAGTDAASPILLSEAVALLQEAKDALADSEQRSDEVIDCLDRSEAALISAINGERDIDATRAEVAAQVAALLGEAAPTASGAGDQLQLDSDSLEVVSDFLSETADGLDAADDVLATAESGTSSPEHVNQLFRVFHTVKGTSAFIELKEIERLAHATETLMSEVRDGQRALSGPTLAAVVRSTNLLREKLDLVRVAAGGDGRVPSNPEVQEHIAHLHALLGGGEVTPPPTVDSPAPTQAGSGSRKLKETVKVEVETVARLEALVDELGAVEQGLFADVDSDTLQPLASVRAGLRDICVELRMVSLQAVFKKTSRLARELAKQIEKMVRVEVIGEDTRVPRRIAEAVGDPLVHMVRNALDHGIEKPDERSTTDKPALACLELRAEASSGSIVLTVKDDGRGIDTERVLAKARQKGLVAPDAALAAEEIWQLLFAPGFSTAEQVTALSGRGVGMDVVKQNVEGMGGFIEIESILGQGTSFRMVFPVRGQDQRAAPVQAIATVGAAQAELDDGEVSFF